MSVNNEMKVEFLSISENEGFARTVVAAFVVSLDPTVDELNDIKTAVSEAVTNAIIHGYGDNTDWVAIEGKITDNYIEIIVEDKGRGIEDIELARQALYTTNPEMERSGMGFTVMEMFMDSIEVTSVVGKGTKVKMVKKIGG